MTFVTCKIHELLDISSANIDTLVLSFYQCAETLSIEVFLTVLSATSAPGRVSFATFANVLERISLPNYEPLLATDISHRK
jgi:hypothetical protein